MVSAYVEAGALRLAQKGIIPIYDGSYIDHETNEWHDTYQIQSETRDQLYIIDVERRTGLTHCTCEAVNDFGKFCKHIRLLNASFV